MQHNIISNELHTTTRTAATDTFALDENQREDVKVKRMRLFQLVCKQEP